MRNIPHAKKFIVDKNIKFKSGGHELPAITYEILGISFTPKSANLHDLRPKAPLQPQQNSSR